jgi:hypothetical protein
MNTQKICKFPGCHKQIPSDEKLCELHKKVKQTAITAASGIALAGLPLIGIAIKPK